MRQLFILAMLFCCIVSLTPYAISADAKLAGKAGKSKKHPSSKAQEITLPAIVPATGAVAGKPAVKSQPTVEIPAAKSQPAAEKPAPVLEEFRAIPAKEEPKSATAESTPKVASHTVLEEFRSIPAKEEPKSEAVAPPPKVAPPPAAPVPTPAQTTLPASQTKVPAATKTAPVEAAPKAAPKPAAPAQATLPIPPTKASVAEKTAPVEPATKAASLPIATTPAKVALPTPPPNAPVTAKTPPAEPSPKAASQPAATIPTKEALPAPPLKASVEAKPAALKTTIKAITTRQSSIEIRSAGHIADYKTHKLVNPGKLVIEIPDAQSEIAANSVPINIHGINRARIGGTPGSVRIVLETSQAAFPVYNVVATKRGLRIEIIGAANQAAAEATAKPAEVATAPVEKKTAPALLPEKKSGPKVSSQPVIKGVVSGQSYIDIQASCAISNFKVSKLDDPPRLLIDIPGATSAIRGKSFAIDKNGISKAQIGGNTRFLRIVVESKQAQFPAHTVTTTGNGLRIAF